MNKVQIIWPLDSRRLFKGWNSKPNQFFGNYKGPFINYVRQKGGEGESRNPYDSLRGEEGCLRHPLRKAPFSYNFTLFWQSSYLLGQNWQALDHPALVHVAFKWPFKFNKFNLPNFTMWKLEKTIKILKKISKYNKVKGGGSMKPYVINKWVQLILTVPYRGGEVGSKSEKLP